MRRIGELLIGRGVPFSEVVVSMHLFEESAGCVFAPGASPATYHLFDKIRHCRTVILADTYFRSRTAAAAAPRAGSALSLAGAERELIRRALADARGNKCRAAELLGISRKMLYARMARHGLVWRRGSRSGEERPPSEPS